MVIVTLGSQKFQFNRLLRKVDELVGDGVIEDEVFAQIGYSDYRPQNYKYTDFMSHDDFERLITRADCVITHGGVGVIFKAVKMGKKVIAVPRLARYGEHVDDHQLQILEAFQSKGIISSCNELQDLERVYRSMIHSVSCNNIDVQQEAVKHLEEEGREFISSIEQYIMGIK